MFLYIAIGLLCLSNSLAQDVRGPKIKSSRIGAPEVYYPNEKWSDPFDWQILKAISSSHHKNLIISPITLKLVLALLYEGASGTTEKEIQHVLQFPEDRKLVRENFVRILSSLQKSEKREYVLKIATEVFLDASVQPQQNFAAKALHHYQTNIESVNFADGVLAAKSINDWVKNATNGRVQTLVHHDDVNKAVMIIASALYFKGAWKQQFPKNQTTLQGFYISPSEIVEVPYMTVANNFYYYNSNELGAQILRLPYRGDRFSLFLVLPNSRGGLSDLINKLSLETLKRQLYLLDSNYMQVIIPKFKFDFQARYTKFLQELGLHDMFHNSASFPGIARGTNDSLFVSDVIQKSGIEVDEEGTIAYSATEFQFDNKFGVVKEVFNATHPFLFFLEEETSGTILFVGKVENPLEVEAIPLPSRIAEDVDQAPKGKKVKTHVKFTANGFVLSTTSNKVK